MAVGAETEVLHCLPSILRSAEKESVCSSRGTQSELVQSQDLTTSLLNPGPSSSRETKCCNRQLRDSQKTVVVSDGADHNDSLALVGVGHIGYNARERNGGAIDPGHEKAAQDDLVEVGFRTTCKNTTTNQFPIAEIGCTQKTETYGRGIGRASPRLAGRRSRSWAPCDGCRAHGGGPSRYLYPKISICQVKTGNVHGVEPKKKSQPARFFSK